MRKLHIFTLLAAFLIIIGCTEEKDFYFNVNKTANVNFKAINLTVGSPDSGPSPGAVTVSLLNIITITNGTEQIK